MLTCFTVSPEAARASGGNLSQFQWWMEEMRCNGIDRYMMMHLLDAVVYLIWIYMVLYILVYMCIIYIIWTYIWTDVYIPYIQQSWIRIYRRNTMYMMYIYLEPKWLFFWLEKALIWGLDLQNRDHWGSMYTYRQQASPSTMRYTKHPWL